MSLDCLTPAGQRAIEAQRAILDRFLSVYPDVECLLTATDQPAAVDAVIGRRGVVVAVAEVKARNATLACLREQFGSYLITASKIEEARKVGMGLSASTLLIVGLLDAIVWWKLAAPDGSWLVPFRCEETVTQATVNGGSACRLNAYLSLEPMKVALVWNLEEGGP